MGNKGTRVEAFEMKSTAILIKIEEELTAEQAKKLQDKIVKRLREVSELEATASCRTFDPDLGEVCIYQP